MLSIVTQRERWTARSSFRWSRMGREPGDGFFMADFTLLEVAEMRKT